MANTPLKVLNWSMSRQVTWTSVFNSA